MLRGPCTCITLEAHQVTVTTPAHFSSHLKSHSEQCSVKVMHFISGQYKGTFFERLAIPRRYHIRNKRPKRQYTILAGLSMENNTFLAMT